MQLAFSSLDSYAAADKCSGPCQSGADFFAQR